MQWHKRDWCTHSSWHRVQYFTPTVTSLLPPPSNILYRVRYKTGLEFQNIMQWGAGVRIFQCGFAFADGVQHVLSLCSRFILPLFCVIHWVFTHILTQFLSMLLFVVPLPHRVLSLSFFKWLKRSEEKRMWRINQKFRGISGFMLFQIDPFAP